MIHLTVKPPRRSRKVTRTLVIVVPDRRLGARGLSGAGVTHGAHISHSSAQPILQLGGV
jgi:hypothetical protein